MKKDYLSPEFNLVKISFEKILEDDYELIGHSGAQDIGEQSGEGDF